ncbi:PREDICTED: apolipophorins-like [Priapulus caudatus]|uniref:Apolipophorins-like n=1 Tax=Priapulus caudatus TaxID=37621 RepID=A0ABM1EBU0_PRICU|nr:PREDICTED: apolipophorins-like [Priapulus caudatus]
MFSRNEYIGHSDFNLESYYLPSDVPSVGIQTSTNLTSTMRGMSIGLKKGQTQVVLAGWKYYFRTEPTNGKKLELSLVTPDMPLTVLLVESSKSDDQAKLNVELQKAAEKVYEAEISYDYKYSRGKQIYEYIVISKCPYHKLNLEAKSEVQDRDNWNHQLLYRWGDHPSKKFGFVVRSSLEGRSPLTMITTAGMVLPSRAYEVTVRDEYSSRHFERALEVDWDAKRDIVTSTTPSSRVSGSPSRASLMARHEREKLSEGEEAYHTIITLQHPFMDEDVVLSNDMTVGAWSSPVPLLSVTSLSYAPGADDNVTVQLHVRNDDDGYGSSNVSAAWSVTHPATNLALRFYGFRFSDGKRIEAEGCAEYQEANGELQRISVKGQHSMERTTVEVATPVLLWKGEAALRYTMDGSRYSAALSSQLNDRPPATVDAEVQATRPFSANAKVTWDATRPDEYSELWAGYLNETALKVHIVDLNARHDGPETYLLAEAMLNTSHILHLHTYTKPDIEYPDYVSNGPTYANIVTRVVGDYVEQEAAERYHLMRSEIHSLKSKYNQIKRKSNRIVAKMGSDVDMVMREHKLDVFAPLDRVEQLQDWSRRMVQSASEKVGEFYEGEAYREWQDQRRQQQERMSEAYSSAVQRAAIAREDLRDATRQRINDWYDRYYTYKAEATDWIAPYKEEVDRYYYELYYKVEEYLSAIAERIAPLYDYIPVREIQECVRSCLQRIKQKIMSIYETMERHRQTNTAAGTDKVSAMREQLMNSWDAAAEHEYVQAAQGHLGKMSTMYDDLDTGVVTRRWDDVKNTYNGMQYRVNDVYNGMQDTYNDYKYRAKDQAQRTYDAMMKNEDAQYVRDVAQKAYGKGQWMYRYAEVDKLGSRALARLIALVKDYRNTVRIVVTPTPPNEFMADLYLQQDWHSFYELPYDAQYGDEQSLSRAIKYVRDLRLSDIQHGMWNQYYAYAPPSYDFIPPFEGSAMMAGSQHFFTFDSHAYDFASGGCSYVLAHDFVDGTFSIIVNYIRGDNDAITRTITVISNGMKIELAPAFQVMLGQNTVDLPIQFDNTTIVRRGDNVIVHNLHGVTVTCDWLRDVCRVNVSGWYFGKMAGLLGTYNNEAYDEFTDLRHNIKDYDEVMSFASSWNYGPCKNGMDRAYSYEVEASDADTFCSAIFQDKQSNFRRCFGQVDPEPFFRMCYNDARHSDHAPSAPPPSCTAAKAYVDECRDRGVRLSMPTTCVICETDRTRHFKNDVYEIGEDSTQDIDIQQYADVVFIVEEKQCNKIAVRSLVDLAKDLDTSLQENGLTSNRYALVGYGGYGVHDAPHVHTSKSRVFTTEPLSLAFDRLVIDGSEGTNDTMRAVEFATELPFRSGVSKTIVLITCSGCESEYMTMDYTKLQRQLLENGFKLHIMSDYNLRFKGAKRSSKNRQLLGIDGKSVCTLKDVRDVELECEESLYRQVVMPKDICVALAHETNGSMFSLNRFTNSALQKKFINVFSRRIAKTASPSPCQVCVCAENEDGAAVARCRPCEMPKPLSFVMMFPEEYTYDDDDDDDDTSNESNVPKTRTRKTRKNKKNRKSKRRNSFFFF